MAVRDAHSIKEVRLENPEEIMRKYKASGDIELRNSLVMHYLQYVNTAIFGMRNILLSSVPYDDFFDQGVLALIDCIERYNPDRGASFDTYSYLGIRGAMLKYLRKQNWISNRLWDIKKQMNRAKTELEQKLLREPTDAELAQSMGMTEQELSKAMVEMSVVDTVSFEELLESAWESKTDCYADPAHANVGGRVLKQELRAALAGAIEELSPKHKQVITLYYHENLNLREIGEVLEISQQRVSQIRSKALECLGNALKSAGFDGAE